MMIVRVVVVSRTGEVLFRPQVDFVGFKPERLSEGGVGSPNFQGLLSFVQERGAEAATSKVPLRLRQLTADSDSTETVAVEFDVLA
jgi:hypothetical protein